MLVSKGSNSKENLMDIQHYIIVGWETT